MSQLFKIPPATFDRYFKRKSPWFIPKRWGAQRKQKQLLRTIVAPTFEAWANALNGQAEDDVVTTATEGQSYMLALYVHDLEVKNGGFSRFFYSRKGRFAPLALSGFQVLGAGQYVTVMQSAIGIYPDAAVPKDVEDRRKPLKDRKNSRTLKRCDNAIRHLWKSDPLLPYVEGYIKRHLDDFVLDNDPEVMTRR